MQEKKNDTHAAPTINESAMTLPNVSIAPRTRVPAPPNNFQSAFHAIK